MNSSLPSLPSWATGSTRARRAGVALTVCASLVLLVPAGTGAARADATVTATSAHPVAASSNGRYILRLAEGADADAVASGVQALGGRVVAAQEELGTVVVEVPADVNDGLSAVAGVTAVAPDSEVEAQSLGFDPATQAGSMTNVTKITGATEFWKAGYTGKGVDVAIIDTGVAPVSGLLDTTKVVVGPDLSFESQSDDTRYLDTYGHGTNMAGIIAGRETTQKSGNAYAQDTGNFLGMAPDAQLVSLKLADHGGAVDVSQMIAAIDWVVAHQYDSGMDIRVLNISYGTISQQDAQADPLSWAAEVAWKRNIAVVASTGNDGDTVIGLASPAYNPWVIAVGAQDTKGTTSYADDAVPSFSERGIDGGRAPDLIAPGVGIVSLGVPGSNLYETYPAAHIGNGFLRGSGTSQSAAVVSGAAALILSKYPSLSADGLKGFLTSTATKLSGVSATAQGAGALNLRTALTATPTSTTQTATTGNGFGTLEKARGGRNLTMDGVALTGEKDIFGMDWSTNQSNYAAWMQAWSWDGWFNGSQWTGGAFVTDTTSWAGKTWQGKTWQGKTWQGKTWQGKTWQGKTWQVGIWNGSGWSSASWSGPVVTPAWSGRTWSSAAWK